MNKHQNKKFFKSGFKLSKLRIILFAAIFSVIGGFTLWRAFAAPISTELYLSPSSQSVTTGQNFSVQIRLINSNPSNSQNYAKAYLNFPADKLAVTSISETGTNFSQTKQQTFDNNAGTISVIRTNATFLDQGDFLVTTVNFSAKAAGAASVSFNNQSGIYLSFLGYIIGTNLLSGSQSGTYTINNPVPPPAPPPPPPAPKPTPSPKPTPTTTPPSVITPVPSETTPPKLASSQPVINSVYIDGLSYTVATVSWDTDPATTSIFSYGTTKNDLKTQIVNDQPNTKHLVQLRDLQPGTKYFFDISVASNQKTANFQSEIITRGLPVTLFIKTTKGVPLSARVTVNGVSKTTANDGSVIFELPAGQASAYVESSSINKKFYFSVKPQVPGSSAYEPKPQIFRFEISTGFLNSKFRKIIAVLIIILLLSLSIYKLLLKRNKFKNPVRSLPASTHQKHSNRPDLRKPVPELQHPPVPSQPQLPPVVAQNMKSFAAPPPHSIRYPWIPKPPTLLAKKRNSSIAKDENYIQPEDMFEEGNKRLIQEGLIPDQQEPKIKPPS